MPSHLELGKMILESALCQSCVTHVIPQGSCLGSLLITILIIFNNINDFEIAVAFLKRISRQLSRKDSGGTTLHFEVVAEGIVVHKMTIIKALFNTPLCLAPSLTSPPSEPNF